MNIQSTIVTRMNTNEKLHRGKVKKAQFSKTVFLSLCNKDAGLRKLENVSEAQQRTNFIWLCYELFLSEPVRVYF